MEKQRFRKFKQGGASLLAGILLASSLLTPGVAAADTISNTELSRQAAAQSMVLLKNQEETLPLQAGSVAVFGSAAIHTFYTPFGSGSINGLGMGIMDSLSILKERITVDATLEELYRQYNTDNPPDTGSWYQGVELLARRSLPEMPLTDAIVSAAANRNNQALVFIGRTNGEGYDWTEEEYKLTAEEQNMITLVTRYFDKVTVILNTANPIDMTWDNDQVDAILWMGMCGPQGPAALTDLLTGAVNPSGKVTETWPVQITDTATYANYMTDTIKDIDYEEDIYAGYRYYDTFNVTPAFPFGYGLSYTTFSVTPDRITADADTVTVTATVKNTGKTAGKEVLQVYYSAPDGKLEKAYQELAGFAKTDLLQPGESQTLTVSFTTSNMASYDETQAAYLLEAGDYIIRVGNSSRNTQVAARLHLDQTVITQQLSNQCQPSKDIDTLTKAGATPWSYPEEEAQLAAAPVVPLLAANFETVQGASVIPSDPALLEGSVDLTDSNASGAPSGGGSTVGGAVELGTVTLPGSVQMSDLNVNFAGYIVNADSGDQDGKASVTITEAGNTLSFPYAPAYTGGYTATLRYYTDTAATVTLNKDNAVLGTFRLTQTGQWATATLTGLDLSGAANIRVTADTANITLNWIRFQSETHVGLVTASLPAGAYGEDLSVQFYDRDNPDAAIYYTTDGSTPTEASALYTGPIAVTGETTLRASAVKSGLENSLVTTVSYTRDASVTAKAATPSIQLYQKSESGAQMLTLSTETGNAIFYTTDGSAPTTASTLYTGPITVAAGKTVKAVAVGPGVLTSDAATLRLASVATPIASLDSSGTYQTGSKVTLSAGNATIYYTISTDGTLPTTPTAASSKYTGAITLSETGRTIIRAVAITASGMSSVATFVYQVTDHVYTLEDVYLNQATVEQVVAQMTTAELAEVVCSAGKSTRFACPGFTYADGPLGCKYGTWTGWAATNVLASSWDVDVMSLQGDAIGGEMAASGCDIWLAPGVDTLRDPRSGRNDEYFSEDPLLAGILASRLIIGVQSHGVGVSVKHFACNDQETNRKYYGNINVTERALREIYLKPFEIVVRTAQPWTIMSTYCDFNGICTASNFSLLTGILRGEWDFQGLVVTDWGCYADNATMQYAGNDLIMPGGNASVVVNAVEQPESVNTGDSNYTAPLTKAMLQRNVVNIFRVLTRTNSFANSIGQAQTYTYAAPESSWMSSLKADITQAPVAITVVAEAGGSASLKNRVVYSGGSAIVAVTPDTGKCINTITVIPETAYQVRNNKILLTQVTADTTVQITFQSASASGITILRSGVRAAQAIYDAAQEGTTAGCYIASDMQTLAAAIDTANALVRGGVTVAEAQEALGVLERAVARFQANLLPGSCFALDLQNILTVRTVDRTGGSPTIGAENTSDEGGGQNTAYTEAGTYMIFALDVQDPGYYTLELRTAVESAGATYQIYLDNTLLQTTVEPSSTGGWQSWVSENLGQIPIGSGLHTLKIAVLESGINFNWIRLTGQGESVDISGASALLDAIDTLTPIALLDETDAEIVESLRANYDSLNPVARSMITNYATLVAAESHLANLPEDPSLLGDLNEDGKLSVTDVVLLRKAILSGNSAAQTPLGDLNGDNSLSVTDVVLLRKAILNQN